MAKTTKQPKSTDSEVAIKVAKFGFWQPILVALISAIATGFTVYYGVKPKAKDIENEAKPVVVVPPQNSNIVKELPEESNAGLYQLIKDISIFDLRQWKHTPDSLKETRHTPTNYTNYLHIKKTSPLDKIVIHYGTSGFGIDMRCITNSFQFFQKEKPDFHNETRHKEYALVVDISNMPLNKEFLVVVEATYWNGFANLNEEDASTYTDDEIQGLDELGLIVFFPDNKPFKEYSFLDRKFGETEDSYRGTQSSYADVNKRFIYWSIKDRQAGHHYRLKWTW